MFVCGFCKKRYKNAELADNYWDRCKYCKLATDTINSWRPKY